MAKIALSASQLREGMPLDTGWYQGRFKELKRIMNKNKDAINYYPAIEVSEPDGSKRVIDDALLTFKMKGHGVILARLFAALEDRKIDPKAPFEFDDEATEQFKDREIWVRLVQEVDNRNGKMRNAYDNFLPGNAPDPTASPF